MKILPLLFQTVFCCSAFCQNFQVHYDLRHSFDPKLNPRNFPSFTFEYFKNIDTIGTGSFLLKVQADMRGEQDNVGQVFTQISQSLRFWKPKVYLSVGYSGGVGVAAGGYGFYIANAFSAGIAYPFQWKGAWLSASLLYRYNAFRKPSHDPQLTFYFGKGISNYRVFVAGSFVFWSQNRDQGDTFTEPFRGKKFAFFGDPQIWVKIKGNLSAGSRINVFYHLITDDNKLTVYPTVGLKYQFQ